MISIHAPREGCDYVFGAKNQATAISTHAPREGCDYWTVIDGGSQKISTHAPREGCDVDRPNFLNSPIDFNPRTP